MIRPYVAVIKDSFREALASRVLVVVLGLITLVLLGFAPLTFIEKATVSLRPHEVPEWPQFADALRMVSARQKQRAAEHLWGLFTDDEKKAWDEFRPLKDKPNFRDMQEFQRSVDALTQSLNRILKLENFYDRNSWRDVDLSLEARTFFAEEKKRKLESDEIARRNRVLLENAFVGLVQQSPATSLQFQYAFYKLADPMPVRRQQLTSVVQSALPWLIDKGLLAIGLFIAILVTAPTIPQMFDPGSLHLLLSKPVSRSMLFLAKFIGGCAFVVICATYLFVGIWLILGGRLGIWEPRLLYCIPLYAFVFMIYYAVSALAALQWRNTIIAIVAAGLFWGFCFGLGFAKQSLEGPMEKARIVRLTMAKDSLIAVTGLHMPLEWNSTTNDWQRICVSEEQEQFTFLLSVIPNLPPPVGPIYDPKGDQLVRIGFSFGKGRPAFVSGKRTEGWKYVEGPPPPPRPIVALHETDGSVLIVSNMGLFRITGDVRVQKEQPKIFGIAIPFSAGGPVTELQVEPSQGWNNPTSAAIDSQTGMLAVYTRGHVILLEKAGHRTYRQVQKKQVLTDESSPATIAIGGGYVLVAGKNGKILLLDEKSLEEEASFSPEGKNPPRAAAASPDGKRFAVVFHTGKCWLIDPVEKKSQLAAVTGQGDISAILFTEPNRLLVAHQVTTVSDYDLTTGKRERHFAPPLALTDWVYRYAIIPAYTLFPKPGEFYKTVQYLLTDQQTVAQDDDTLEAAQQQLHPWSPVWSGGLFVAVVLVICCVYIERQEF